MTAVSYRGLRLRMALASVALAVAPFAVAYGAVYALNAWGADVAAASLGYRWYGQFYVQPGRVGVGFVVLLGVTYWVQRRRAVSILEPSSTGGVEHPALAERVGLLAEDVGVPDPGLVATASERPVALTVGLVPGDQTLVVTDGLRSALSEDELDAVLVHELAHQRNRDAAVRSLAATALSLLYVVALPWVLVGLLKEALSDSEGSLLVPFRLLTLPFALPFLAARVAFARSFSHYGEYVADSAASAVTGNPDALADALETLQGSAQEPAWNGLLDALATVPSATLAAGSDAAEDAAGLASGLQPSTARRVDRLRAFAGDE